jgi:spore germination protein GerM
VNVRIPHGRVVRALASVLCAGLLAGCAIGPDDQPRDITRSATPEQASPAAVAAAASGAGRIFLLAPDVPGLPTRLQAVARDVPDDGRAVLQALLAGPNVGELADQLHTALPASLQLRSVGVGAGGVLVVDLASGIEALSGDVLIAAVAQIVYTSSELPGVDAVSITVNGAPAKWPAGNGELQSAPLTTYDYPGWDPSSQPPYPGIPAG